MNTRTRLFRKPFTTTLWSLLVILMALLLGVGCTLNYSTMNLLPTLSQAHTSVALRTDRAYESISTQFGAYWTFESKFFTQEDMDFFMQMDCVEAIYYHSLTGGYIPELTPALGVYETHGRTMEYYDNVNESYDEVIFVGTVLRILEETAPFEMDLSILGYGSRVPAYTVYAEVRIDQIVQAHPDYPFAGTELYTGIVNCQFSLCGEEARGFIAEGGQYLLSGEYDPNAYRRSGWPEDSIHPMVTTQITGVCEEGVLWGHQYYPDYTTGEITDIRIEPIAVKLEGTLDVFLADPANSEWMDWINACAEAQHSMPIIGTDNLKSMYLFLSEDASIVAGRGFTQEEYDSGAKVCILSETVANGAGIAVGDTVHISQYLCDEVYNRSIAYESTDGMLNNPTVGEPAINPEYVTDSEEFVVIGLYRQTNEWEETSYSITPNTVFIPKNAQIPGGFGEMSETFSETQEDASGDASTHIMITDRGSYGIYFSIVVKNGCMDDFELAISETKWADQFHTFGQGYDGLIDSVNDVAATARNMLFFAVALWLMLLTLYVLLYQNSQRKNIGIMRSLGAKPKQAKRFLFGSGFGLASFCVLVGTLLTIALTGLLNHHLVKLMLSYTTMERYSGGMELTEEVLTQMVSQSQLPTAMLIAMACMQIAVMAAVLWIHASFLSKKAPRKLLGV